MSILFGVLVGLASCLSLIVRDDVESLDKESLLVLSCMVFSSLYTGIAGGMLYALIGGLAG